MSLHICTIHMHLVYGALHLVYIATYCYIPAQSCVSLLTPYTMTSVHKRNFQKSPPNSISASTFEKPHLTSGNIFEKKRFFKIIFRGACRSVWLNVCIHVRNNTQITAHITAHFKGPCPGVGLVYCVKSCA